MKCENRVTVFVERGNSFREIKMVCGSTGPYGVVELCSSCMDKAVKKYPQGWKYYPGDTCKHGTYLNPMHDCNCAYCEMED